MAKFTRKGTMREKTTNYEGGEAFVLNDHDTLLNLVSTCMVNEPKFYGQPGETEQKILMLCDKIAQTDPKFILQLAAYVRTELYLRSVSTMLLTEAASISACKPYVRQYCPKIIQRADEIYETMACQLSIYGKPIPNSLKKGISDSFSKFDEYQFAKYNRKTDVSFQDVILLTHPKQPSELIKKIMENALATPETWETQISTRGNKPEVWQELIDHNKLPYMAMLRNLRNMLKSNISQDYLKKVITILTDPERVKHSKQLPFRFFSAYKLISEEGNHRMTPDILDALDTACELSYSNIPKMDGTTVIACDVSGSMMQPVSKNSTMQLFDIGLLLASATNRYTDNSIVGIFGDTWKVTPIKKNTGVIQSVLDMRSREGEVGYSTNGWAVIQYLIDNNIVVDRILLFTDAQMWDSTRGGKNIRTHYENYKRKINKDVKLYLFNLNGYGTVSFLEQDKSVVNINGWSDKILSFININEKGGQVKYIREKY